MKHSKFKLDELIGLKLKSSRLIFKLNKFKFKSTELTVLKLKLNFVLSEIYISQDLKFAIWTS